MISSIIMPFSIMQLTVSYISPVSQQDIEVSIKQLDIYIILMLYNAVFSNQ